MFLRSFPGLVFALFFFFQLSSSAQEEDLASRMDNAIKLLQSSGQSDPSSLALMFNSAAEGYIERGDFNTALERIKESLRLCREADVDPTSPFFTASKILTKADPDVAKGFLLNELNAPGVKATYKMGVLKALQMHLAINGDQKLAIQVAYELWELTKKEMPETYEEFWALFQYGSHCLTGQLYDLAGPALREAKALALKMNKPELAANCSRSIGYTLSADQKYDEALKFFEEELEFCKADPEQIMVPFALHNIARTQIMLDRFKEAEKTLAEVEALADDEFDRATIAEMRAGIAMKLALAKGGKPDLSDAIKLQKTVIEEKSGFKVGGEENIQMATLGDYITLATLQVLNGDLDDAKQSVGRAARNADAWEENSRRAQKSAVFSADQVNISMADIRGKVYDLEQRIDVLEGKVADALVAAENGRGTAQAEILKKRLGIEASDRVVKELEAKDIAEIAKEHNTTLVVYSLSHDISPTLRQFFKPTDRMQHPQQLFIWVVSPDGKYQFRSVAMKGPPLAHLIQGAREEIIRPPEKKPAESAVRQLSSVLLDPVREVLPKEEGALVTIVPQGQLFLVPFSALPDKDGKPLIDQYVIGLSPSVELLRLAKEQRQAVEEAGLKDILIVGNPTMPGFQSRPDRGAVALSPLPGAEAEAKFLGKMLKVEPLLGDAATEKTVTERMKSARYLHFATHGLLSANNAYKESFLSSLAFAKGDKEDGFLTVRETAAMKLRAELAVLSACDTGRGSISGDGVLGLSRGYITAGVPTVVVSLWPVSDQATALLMANYYQAMMKGTPKAAALRDAIRETKKKFPNPQQWAPFVLYGLAS